MVSFSIFYSLYTVKSFAVVSCGRVKKKVWLDAYRIL